MKCLVTGASSGIGRDMCIYLSSLGHEIIMVSKNEEKLISVQKLVKNSKIFVADLNLVKDVDKLCDMILDEKPEIVINNAGFGAFGFFNEVSLDRELEMINVNLISLHKITKSCLEYMEGFDNSYILNVSSIAGLMPGGPLLSTYYATKSYVRSFSLGLYKELRKMNSKINLSVLCPGPVNTNFNNVASVKFSVKALSSEYVAKYAIDKMFKRKTLIIPGFSTKVGFLLSKFLPYKILLNIMFSIQRRKRN